MEREGENHLVLGGLLFLVFSLVVALVFVYTRAGDTTTFESPVTTATIDNEAPVVESVNIAYTDNGTHIATSTGIDLAVGTTKTVVVWGTVSDANGTDTEGPNTYGDIDNVNVALYRSGATGGSACTADNNDCYKVASCTISANSGTTAHYACTMALQFYTDSTTAGGEFPAQDWHALVVVSDLSSATDSAEALSEVNTLLALNIPTTIPYGTFALGATTTNANNQDMVLEQKGNARADVEASGTAMTCTGLGTIPVGNQRWSLTDVGYSHASTTALTGSAVDTNIDVQFRHNDGAAETKTLTWNIGIPATGVRGVCTGSNTLTVLAH